ncbi:hypothetical protein SB775_26440 [Peribacillus sp. SIMBA_075]|uniref:TIGR04104 family putative zinc finger protein n=1 Tax=Peribacillus sp. SIMBA_075 TaxID=3085813 RepID=UPI00397CCBAA
MNIQKCESCENQFTWREVERTTTAGFGYQPLICKKCGTKHEVTTMTRIIVALLVPIFIFILNSSNLLPFYIPFYVGLPIILVLFFAVMLSFPYFGKYKAVQNRK